MPAALTAVAHAGMRFDVRDTGPRDGPVALLLHGFPQHGAAWDAVVPLLHAQGLRTVVPDQRGYSPGARPWSRSAYALEQLVGDVEAFVAASGAERVHLVGHDWGAGAAWATAIRRPHLVRSLVSVSIPHPAAFARSLLRSRQGLRSWYMAAFQLPGLPERLLDPATPRGRARLRRSLLDSGQDPAHADRDLDLLSAPEAFHGAVGWYRGIPVETRRRGPTTCAVPTAVVWGDADPFVVRAPLEASARYVDGPFRLDVLTGAGHWVPEQAPQAVADAVAWAVTASA